MENAEIIAAILTSGVVPKASKLPITASEAGAVVECYQAVLVKLVEADQKFKEHMAKLK